MKVRVLFFAQLRDAFRKDECILEIKKGTTVGTLVQSIFQDQKLEPLRLLPLLYAVNDDFVKDNQVIGDGDVLAILPPIAGG